MIQGISLTIMLHRSDLIKKCAVLIQDSDPRQRLTFRPVWATLKVCLRRFGWIAEKSIHMKSITSHTRQEAFQLI